MRSFKKSSIVWLLLPSTFEAATVEPYPADFNIDVNDNENIHFSGTLHDFASGGNWEGTPFMIESDVPVILNRMTKGTSSSLTFGIPFGVSVVVKSDCSGDRALEIPIDPQVTLSTVDNGDSTTTSKVKIRAAKPVQPMPAMEQRVEDPTFLPSSNFTTDYYCMSQLPEPCVPTEDPATVVSSGPTPTDTPHSAGIDLVPGGDEHNQGHTEPTASPTEPDTNANRQAQLQSGNSGSNLMSIHGTFVFVIVSTLSLLWLQGGGGGGHRRQQVLQVAALLMVPTVFSMMLASTQGDLTSALLTKQQRHLHELECIVNVEIVYWGCDHSVLIAAPHVVLRDDQSSYKNGWGTTCQCQWKHGFEDALEEPWSNVTQTGIQSDSGIVYNVPGGPSLDATCMLAIGRPYRDQGGGIKTSKVNKEAKEHVWSQSDMQTPAIKLPDLETEWTKRAVGEHASIASFAAFTIALMSNQAPPDLIRYSLIAAQDELRHAQVSFEMASLLAGKPIEPTALPPSQLSFTEDLAHLAYGTAHEGCIEETLSAIAMVVDYDEYWTGEDNFFQTLLEKTRSMALEEGNHSALAWRTMTWICDKDATACPLELLDAHYLQQHAKNYSPRVQYIWTCLWTNLLAHVLKEQKPEFDAECPTQGLSALLVERILGQVMTGEETGDENIATITRND